jgi:hypothetical protein
LRTELDMEVEVASTILAYVQTHATYSTVNHDNANDNDNIDTQCTMTPYIRFISQVHSTCTIKFHADCPSILSRQWPVVNGILSIYNQALPADVKHGEYTISLSQLALLLRADIGDIQRDLLRLRWQRQCTIKWSDPSLCIQTLRVANEGDISTLASDIHKNFTRQEELQLSKVDTITTVFNNVMLNDWQHVYPHKSSSSAVIDVEETLKHGDKQSKLIHSMVDAYLMCDDEMNIKERLSGAEYKLPSASHNSELQTLLQRSSSTVARSQSSTATASTICIASLPPSTLLSDYYSFLRRNRTLAKLPDELAFARIAFGVGSAAMPSSMWKHDPLWGKHKDGVEFQVLHKYAQHALTKWNQRIKSGEFKQGNNQRHEDEDEEEEDRRQKVLIIKAASNSALSLTQSRVSDALLDDTHNASKEDSVDHNDEQLDALI